VVSKRSIGRVCEALEKAVEGHTEESLIERYEGKTLNGLGRRGAAPQGGECIRKKVN